MRTRSLLSLAVCATLPALAADDAVDVTTSPRAGDAPPAMRSAGTLTEIPDPFIGDVTETWEGFLNYNDPVFHYEPNPITIFGGGGVAFDGTDRMLIYEPGPAPWGLGTSGTARTSDGAKGMGQDTPNGTVSNCC